MPTHSSSPTLFFRGVYKLLVLLIMRFSPSISYRLHRFSHLTPPTPVKTWSSTALIDAQKDRFARSGQLCRCGALLEGTSVGCFSKRSYWLRDWELRAARNKSLFLKREREKAQQSLEEVKGNIWGVSSCYDWSIKFPFGVQRVASSPSLVPTRVVPSGTKRAWRK